MTVVVSANFGGFDEMRPQATQDVDCEWLVFTDAPLLEAPDPWQVVHVEPLHTSSRLAAKVYKCTPPVDDTDVVWIDASMQVMSSSFVREALQVRHDGLAVWRHPRRKCVYAEAEASVGRESQGGKYDGEPIAAQMAHYRAEGHPERAGCYACGTVAWDLSNPLAVAVGAAWLAECERWSTQDQLSLPVVCRRLGVQPGIFPISQIRDRLGPFMANRWLRIHPHLVPT